MCLFLNQSVWAWVCGPLSHGADIGACSSSESTSPVEIQEVSTIKRTYEHFWKQPSLLLLWYHTVLQCLQHVIRTNYNWILAMNHNHNSYDHHHTHTQTRIFLLLGQLCKVVFTFSHMTLLKIFWSRLFLLYICVRACPVSSVISEPLQPREL